MFICFNILQGYAVTDQLFRQKGTFQERKSSSDIRHSGKLNNYSIFVTF